MTKKLFTEILESINARVADDNRNREGKVAVDVNGNIIPKTMVLNMSGDTIVEKDGRKTMIHSYDSFGDNTTTVTLFPKEVKFLKKFL